MIAQSIYHRISRFGSRGRKLVLKTFIAHPGGERQRFSEHNGYEWLEILASGVGAEDIVRRGRRAVEPLIVSHQRGPAPSLVITLELKTETHAVAADVFILI